MKPYCQRCRKNIEQDEESLMVFDKYEYQDYILVHDECAYSNEIKESQ